MSRQRQLVFLEEGLILQQRKYLQDQYVLRLHLPRCSNTAMPGQFIYLQCDSNLRMRRPYSIMSSSPSQGWVEVLYKIVGYGSSLLGAKRQGDILSSIGPIGNGFIVHDQYPRSLLLGGGVGMPPIFFLAESLKNHQTIEPLVIFSSERVFPFSVCRSKIHVAGFGENNSAHASLEALGIATRLCSKQHYPGCFNGFIDEAADVCLSKLSSVEMSQVEIFACGPQPMLKMIAALAHKYNLPCQLSLEEYMACGLGGCAGCVVSVVDQGHVAMKRVCVDGPVFNLASLSF